MNVPEGLEGWRYTSTYLNESVYKSKSGSLRCKGTPSERENNCGSGSRWAQVSPLAREGVLNGRAKCVSK